MAMGGDRLVTVATSPDAAEPRSAARRSPSPRPRRGNATPVRSSTPAEAAQRLVESGAEDVALVFGSERGGLSLDELRSCHMTLAVPTDPGFPVLNLAQAVGIVLALLGAGGFGLPAPPDPMDLPAPHGEFSAALAHLEEALLASGYLDPQNPARVGDQFRRWFGRTVPTRRELALLRALAAHVTYLVRRSDPGA